MGRSPRHCHSGLAVREIAVGLGHRSAAASIRRHDGTEPRLAATFRSLEQHHAAQHAYSPCLYSTIICGAAQASNRISWPRSGLRFKGRKPSTLPSHTTPLRMSGGSHQLATWAIVNRLETIARGPECVSGGSVYRQNALRTVDPQID